MHSNLEGSALALAADRKNRLPIGCSYQGRHPEAEPGYDDTVPMAAEAATSIGAQDDGDADGIGVFRGLLSALALTVVLAFAALAIWAR